jgi:hypothetical protein
MSSKLININGGFYYVSDEAAVQKPAEHAKPGASAYASSGYQPYVPLPKLQKPAPNYNAEPVEDPREKVARAAKAAAERREAIAQELANAPDNLLILEMTKPDPHATPKPTPKEEEEDDTPSDIISYINFAGNLMTQTLNQATPKAVPTRNEEQEPTIEETSELIDYITKCAHFGEIEDRAKLYPHLNPQSNQ